MKYKIGDIFIGNDVLFHKDDYGKKFIIESVVDGFYRIKKETNYDENFINYPFFISENSLDEHFRKYNSQLMETE